jgi:hypothetical protein
VKVSNVVYKNITGISASEEAINIKYNKSVPCQGILLEDVNLVRQEDASVKATCESILGWQTKGRSVHGAQIKVSHYNKGFAFIICILTFIFNNKRFVF